MIALGLWRLPPLRLRMGLSQLTTLRSWRPLRSQQTSRLHPSCRGHPNLCTLMAPALPPLRQLAM